METITRDKINLPEFQYTPTKTIRAVVYVRVSSDEQVKKEFSIPKLQIPECIKLIKESGWRFVKTYIDEGLDCNTFLKRTALQQMLNDDINDYDLVVVWSYDRLIGDDENTRGQIYSILDRNRKQMTSVRQRSTIVSPEEYDPKSLNVSQLRQVNDLGVSFDRKIRRERFMESRNKIVEGGRHIVEPPFGYKLKRKVIEREGERPRIISFRMVNEEEAVVLKRIFQERVFNRLGGKKIAIKLNEEGFRTRKGTEWMASRIYRILQNPFPCGYIVWSKTQERKFGDESKRTPLAKERWKFIPVNKNIEKHYKPLITKETFDTAQEMSEANKNTGKAPYSKNPLAGLIKCSQCGATMIKTNCFKTKKPPYSRGYYVCAKFWEKGKCSTARVRSWEVDKEVMKKVESYLKNPQQLSEYQKELKEQKVKGLETELKANERRLKKCQDRAYSLNVKYIDGKIKDEYYTEILDSLEKEEVGLNKSITRIRGEIKDYEKQRETSYKLKDISKDFSKRFRELDDRKKKAIFHALIKEITVERDQSIDKPALKGLSIIFRV